MIISSKCKHLLAPILLCGIFTPALADPIQRSSNPPEATQAESSISFWDMDYLEDAFVDTAPDRRKDSLPVGELEAERANKEAIVKLALEIAEDQHGLIDSLLIAKNEKLIFESYYRRGRVDLPHFQASATKSYTSLAVGRAIQMGYLTMSDLDRPVASFLAELDPRSFAEGAELVTLHQAMTMTSGIRISRERTGEINEDSTIRGQAQVQAFFEQTAPILAESNKFLYQDDPILVMHVLEAVVPGGAANFIRDELFGKIGITNYNWRTAASGLPEAGWRSSVASRDMLKIGILVANQGRWNGDQLISEAFIEKATNRIVRVGEEDAFFSGSNISNPGYGYFWWQADMKVGDKSYFTTSAQGGGGQYIILIEELDLIIVTTAHDREEVMMQLTSEKILPAFAN